MSRPKKTDKPKAKPKKRTTIAPRDEKGKFQKGVSGNPTGLPKALATNVKDARTLMADLKTPEQVVYFLTDTMADQTIDIRWRLQAAEKLMKASGLANTNNDPAAQQNQTLATIVATALRGQQAQIDHISQTRTIDVED